MNNQKYTINSRLFDVDFVLPYNETVNILLPSFQNNSNLVGVNLSGLFLAEVFISFQLQTDYYTSSPVLKYNFMENNVVTATFTSDAEYWTPIQSNPHDFASTTMQYKSAALLLNTQNIQNIQLQILNQTNSKNNLLQHNTQVPGYNIKFFQQNTFVQYTRINDLLILP
jgi:hypothetical protein